MATVTVVINVEYKTSDEATANATLARLARELKHQIQEGKTGHALTGVVPGSVRVEILSKYIA